MHIKAEIIQKIILDLCVEMDIDVDEFFDIFEQLDEDVLVGIKLPSTDEIVLFFLNQKGNCRFFLPHELK